MKVLVIRFSSIGDIVLTSPVVRCLQKQLGAEVHFITKPAFKSLVQYNPYIHKVHLLKENWQEMIEELKQENFDHVVDLHKNIRSKRITSALKKPHKTFDKLNLEKWLLVNFKVNRLPEKHIVQRYFDGLQELAVQYDGKGLDLFIPEEEEVQPEQLPELHRNGYIAISIGANHHTKRLPEEKLTKLCELFSGPVLLLGGPEDAEIGKRIAAVAGEKVYNGCGKFSLLGSASVVKQAEHVVSHDTGLMHIAAALDKPITSVWGSTVPAFGMYTFFADGSEAAKASEIVQIDWLKCRPCSKLGFQQCPLGHFKCMNLIEEEKIVASAGVATGV